jgi:Ca-activated chloride channel family protein
VDIDITYFHTLGFREGGYEFVFPMVIGPRFNPPSPCGTGNGVGSVPVFASGASGQATEVQYLRPDMRSGTDISLSVDVDAGVAIESIESPTHSVIASIDPAMPWRATARLSTGDTIPNRDFVLRYRVSGGQLKGGLITHKDERGGGGGFFSLVLVPPSDLKYTTRGPVELVFVVDCSGSMEGEPLALCKRAVVNALGQLRPEDTFQIVRFSDTCSFMTERPIPAHGDNIRRGFAYVQGLNANGGTMMLKGLEPALEMRGDWNRTRFVCLLSDGLLGNEPEVLEQLKKKLGDSRIFSIGIGSAPNRTLLNAMARIGRGAAGYVATERDADEVTNLFVERISSAAMTDLRIDWGDLEVTDVYPKRLPDLYVGRPVVLYGRYRNANARPTDVRVSGRVGGERQTMTIAARVMGGAASNAPGLPLVWARAKITDLDENPAWGNKDVGAGSVDGPNKGEIRDLALKYGLLSAYTSLVAVDSSERTAGTYGTSVPVPVNVPQGVRYDTTVEGGIGARRVGER